MDKNAEKNDDYQGYVVKLLVHKILMSSLQWCAHTVWCGRWGLWKERDTLDSHDLDSKPCSVAC